MGKAKLKFEKEFFGKSIEEIAHKLWDKYTVDLSSNGTGQRVTEVQFTAALTNNYVDELAAGKNTLNAARAAVKAYDKSRAYRDKADFYNQFTAADLFGGDKKMAKALRSKIRSAKGTYEKYDPNKLLYSHAGFDDEGRKYEEYTYTPGNGKTIYLREYNSPNEWKLYDDQGNEIVI